LIKIKKILHTLFKNYVWINLFIKDLIMRIRVNRGTISKKYAKKLSNDEFAVLFPGIYEAEMMASNEIVFLKQNGDKAYLSMIKIQEKIASGDITFLESTNNI
jgi:hypothetical protein